MFLVNISFEKIIKLIIHKPITYKGKKYTNLSKASCPSNAPNQYDTIHIKLNPRVANTKITVATICTIRFILIAAGKKTTKINANGTINKESAIPIIDISNNSFKSF